MKLSESDLDYEIGYFMKHGTYPPREENKCVYAPAEYDWEQLNEPDSYYCWQGTRLPQWFE